MLKHATKFKPLEPNFQQAEAAGFRYAEFWLDAGVLAQWRTIAEQARRYPLEYALHFPNRADLDDESLDNAIGLYRALNCSAMVIHEPMRRKYHDALLERDAEVRLGVENHLLGINEFEQWASRNRWLTLDVEHLWKFTLRDAPLPELLEKLGDVLDRFGSKIIHVHLPGYLPGYEEHRAMYCAREMIFPVLSLFAAAGYSGLIVGEAKAEFQNPQELRMDALFVERWRRASEE